MKIPYLNNFLQHGLKIFGEIFIPQVMPVSVKQLVNMLNSKVGQWTNTCDINAHNLLKLWNALNKTC